MKFNSHTYDKPNMKHSTVATPIPFYLRNSVVSAHLNGGSIPTRDRYPQPFVDQRIVVFILDAQLPLGLAAWLSLRSDGRGPGRWEMEDPNTCNIPYASPNVYKVNGYVLS